MDAGEFIRECSMGGPGLDGYSYQADVYCCYCAYGIIEAIAAEVAPTLSGTDDPLFSDSETTPYPIFFGESESEQCCSKCQAYLYGGEK